MYKKLEIDFSLFFKFGKLKFLNFVKRPEKTQIFVPLFYKFKKKKYAIFST